MAGFEQTFIEIQAERAHEHAKARKDAGWRYVQMLAVNTEEGVDLLYSYMLDGTLENVTVKALASEAHVPSISDLYLEAFVCENEIHDLFGIVFEGLAIDFAGKFYKVAVSEPMTVISPAQLAAREKAAKIAAAKAAKEKADAAKAAGEETPAAKPAAADDMEAKLAGMDPEKAAKVRAAMEAKAAREAAKAAAAREDGE